MSPVWTSLFIAAKCSQFQDRQCVVPTEAVLSPIINSKYLIEGDILCIVARQYA